MGAAGAVKQTAGFEALALLAIVVGAPDAAGRRGRAALAYIACLALAPFAFLLYFAWHGAAGALLADVVGTALQRPANASEGVSFADGIMRFLPLQRCLLPLTVFTLLALWRRRAIRTAAPDAPFGALAAWLAAACLGVIAQRSLYMQYFAPAVAPALLLASLCAAKALPELARIPEWARLATLAALTLATAFGWPSGDLVRRQDLPALTAAAEAIRASRPAPDDALYVVNRGVWLNSMVDLAPPPPKRYYFPYQTLCDFAGGGVSAIVAILAAHPRYLVVADRRLNYYCELKENWRPIDAALSRSYRLIAHAAGKFDSYDVYEAAPAVR